MFYGAQTEVLSSQHVQINKPVNQDHLTFKSIFNFKCILGAKEIFFCNVHFAYGLLCVKLTFTNNVVRMSNWKTNLQYFKYHPIDWQSRLFNSVSKYA